MPPPEIRPYRPGDEAAILDLYEHSFGFRQTIAQWRWRYVDAPTGAPRIVVAWRGEQCIGQFAYSPMPLAYDDDRVDALMALDGMVHTEYRRSRLFTDLEQSVRGELSSEEPCYGFPNDKSFPLFVGRLGWRSPGRPRVFVKLLSTRRLGHRSRLFHLLEPVVAVGRARDRRGQRGVTLRQFSRFEEIGDLLPRLHRRGFVFRREVDLLNWRFRRAPHPYRLYAVDGDGEPIGFFAVRMQDKFGLRVGWIADLGFTAEARSRLTPALRALARELASERDLLSLLLPHESDRRDLARGGFREAPERLLPHPFYLISRGRSARQSQFDDLDHWTLTWSLHDAI